MPRHNAEGQHTNGGGGPAGRCGESPPSPRCTRRRTFAARSCDRWRLCLSTTSVSSNWGERVSQYTVGARGS
ncbi:uncharacterized protein TRAVEDRAFT_25840 [Trametes versicolor FP-101664 SS1]|uniref:uncharacterized protein n=1 Tax=Trametes versicolor (strain FP-101664) TaxID=717944 RepID=UPI000462441D|nr:uncharacterized protein TRAVEDRAFT_25840 [Trametes versicolor FP-101664 SS1]EIW64774.1 hypothetical protein TRAVEDRAFT_25840 [Trametes versicolor FP-101664 SS1]